MMDGITDSLMTSASAVLDQAGQMLGSLQAFTQPNSQPSPSRWMARTSPASWQTG
jgi:hypothetical protein